MTHATNINTLPVAINKEGKVVPEEDLLWGFNATKMKFWTKIAGTDSSGNHNGENPYCPTWPNKPKENTEPEKFMMQLRTCANNIREGNRLFMEEQTFKKFFVEAPKGPQQIDGNCKGPSGKQSDCNKNSGSKGHPIVKAKNPTLALSEECSFTLAYSSPLCTIGTEEQQETCKRNAMWSLEAPLWGQGSWDFAKGKGKLSDIQAQWALTGLKFSATTADIPIYPPVSMTLGGSMEFKCEVTKEEGITNCGGRGCLTLNTNLFKKFCFQQIFVSERTNRTNKCRITQFRNIVTLSFALDL